MFMGSDLFPMMFLMNSMTQQNRAASPAVNKIAPLAMMDMDMSNVLPLALLGGSSKSSTSKPVSNSVANPLSNFKPKTPLLKVEASAPSVVKQYQMRIREEQKRQRD